MIISITLSLSCFISTVMLVWFKSDAFIEWASLLGFSSQVKEWEYKNQRFEDVTLNYPRFLKMQSEKFIFRLIGCPLCLSFGCRINVTTSRTTIMVYTYINIRIFHRNHHITNMFHGILICYMCFISIYILYNI